MTTYAPQARTHHMNVNWRLIVLVVGVVIAAGLAGYAIAGGFGNESSPGQDVSSKVMSVWASGDTAAINELYAPNVSLNLVYPGSGPTGDTNRKQVTETIKNALAVGNTYTQIGPVTSYTAADGDMYVASLVEVKGAGHPSGVPLVGFYRVHDGKIVQHIFMDAEHY